MTSFIAWIGVDSRGPSSLYLASDSRISWEISKGVFNSWDQGRKLFAATKSPDLLGYVGDVLFPSLVLGQITAAIDSGTLFPPGAIPEARFALISHAIKTSFGKLPELAKKPFTTFYATREGEGMKALFHLWALSWSDCGRWDEESIAIPPISSAIRVSGSGARVVDKWQSYWDSSSQGRTSRAVFGALCDAIYSASDPRSGGAPQLIGLFRASFAKTIGVVVDGMPYLLGMPVPAEQGLFSDIQWRNSLFERVGPTGELLKGAQSHHVPGGLGNNVRRSRSR